MAEARSLSSDDGSEEEFWVVDLASIAKIERTTSEGPRMWELPWA